MRNNRFIPLICFCFIILTGCNRTEFTPTLSAQDASFNSVVPVRVFSDLYLVADGGNQMRIHYTKDIYVRNLSSECVIFPNDFSLSIWFVKNGQWTSLKILNIQLQSQDIVLQPAGELFSENVVTIFPDYDVLSAEKPNSIRVAISGRLCEKGKPPDTIVGNYIDIQVVP